MNMLQSPQVTTPAPQYNVDFSWWPIDWLANYIKKKQRKTITEKSFSIQQNIDLIKSRFGNTNVFFQQLDALFCGSVNRLCAHMKKEEESLFPVIREMLHAKELNRCVNRAAREKTECIIELLNDEHDIESKRVKLSRQLRDNGKAWKVCSKEVKTLYSSLLEFEQDLELHIYLQNKLLFPKILMLI